MPVLFVADLMTTVSHDSSSNNTVPVLLLQMTTISHESSSGTVPLLFVADLMTMISHESSSGTVPVQFVADLMTMMSHESSSSGTVSVIFVADDYDIS